jgi:hypothetical protein
MCVFWLFVNFQQLEIGSLHYERGFHEEQGLQPTSIDAAVFEKWFLLQTIIFLQKSSPRSIPKDWTQINRAYDALERICGVLMYWWKSLQTCQSQSGDLDNLSELKLKILHQVNAVYCVERCTKSYGNRPNKQKQTNIPLFCEQHFVYNNFFVFSRRWMERDCKNSRVAHLKCPEKRVLSMSNTFMREVLNRMQKCFRANLCLT